MDAASTLHILLLVRSLHFQQVLNTGTLWCVSLHAYLYIMFPTMWDGSSARCLTYRGFYSWNSKTTHRRSMFYACSMPHICLEIPSMTCTCTQTDTSLPPSTLRQVYSFGQQCRRYTLPKVSKLTRSLDQFSFFYNVFVPLDLATDSQRQEPMRNSQGIKLYPVILEDSQFCDQDAEEENGSMNACKPKQPYSILDSHRMTHVVEACWWCQKRLRIGKYSGWFGTQGTSWVCSRIYTVTTFLLSRGQARSPRWCTVEAASSPRTHSHQTLTMRYAQATHCATSSSQSCTARTCTHVLFTTWKPFFAYRQ